MISTDLQEEISALIETNFKQLALPAEPEALYGPVRYTLSLGGKRIRPYFALIGCGLCGGETEEAVPAAMAIELLHNFTLLHDDIMDSASTRRGMPSVFKKWDSSTAILSGDAMYAWAFEQLQYYGKKAQFSKEQYHTILDIFLESAKTVCEGQAYDLDFENRASVDLDDYMQMIKGKTAALISGAFKMGGAVAGAGSNCSQKLQKIGDHTGIGFQIQDDLLDVVADPAKFGKKPGGDILEGKKTYLSILSLQRGNEDQKAELRQIFASRDVREENVQNIISLYKHLGVLETASEVIEDHYEHAIQQAVLFKDSIYKDDLIKFLTNLKNREY